MYQTDFVCTYKLFNDDLNSNDQDQLYRIQLLQSFDLNYWDDDKINQEIEKIYFILSLNGCFKEVFIKAKQNNSINEILEIYKSNNREFQNDKINILDENDILFKLLFKYEYFDLTHRCIIDFLVNGTINEKHINKLLNSL